MMPRQSVCQILSGLQMRHVLTRPPIVTARILPAVQKLNVSSSRLGDLPETPMTLIEMVMVSHVSGVLN